VDDVALIDGAMVEALELVNDRSRGATGAGDDG